MYDSRFAGFFLRCSDGRIWHRRRDSKGGSCGPGTPADPKGDIFFWNFSNASAATYFVEQVVLGWRGAGNSAIDGVFLDDPGPGTAAHAMDEYRATLSAAVIGIGIGAAHLATLAHATVATVARAQRALHARGKGLWTNGVEFSNPFSPLGLLASPPAAHPPCRPPWRDRCGWWAAPQPGIMCEEFYRDRCTGPGGQAVRAAALAVHVLADSQQSVGANASVRWRLSLATFLVLRGPQAWLVLSDWQQTGATTPLLWTADLDRDVGTPTGECEETRPGVFSRTWSYGTASVDCADLHGVLPWD